MKLVSRSYENSMPLHSHYWTFGISQRTIMLSMPILLTSSLTGLMIEEFNLSWESVKSGVPNACLTSIYVSTPEQEFSDEWSL